MQQRTFIAVALLVAVTTVSCSGSTEPAMPGDLIVVGGGELTSVAAVSVSQGRVIKRIGPIPAFKDRFALSPDSGRLYVSSFDNVSPVTLTVIDTRSLSVTVQEPMSEIAARSRIGSVLPLGGYALAVSPDGRKLVMNGLCGGDRCVVVVDLATRTPVASIARFEVAVGGLVPLLEGRDSASQRVLMLGSRVGAPYSPIHPLLVLGGPNLEVVDSIQLPRSVGQLIPIGNTRQVIDLAADSIFKIDLGTLQVMASAPRRSSGQACAAGDGQRLYLTDPGSLDFPGTGQVQAYGASLGSIAPIDLRSGGTIPTLNDCAVSRDGRLLLVSSGTSATGPLFTPQPGRIFVIDRELGTVVRMIDTGDWLSREIYAF